MSQPKSLVGLSAPLLEKLIDLSPNSADDDQDLAFQPRDAVAASIRREIARILDTRLPWRDRASEQAAAIPDERGEMQRPSRFQTVTSYGVADFTHLCVRSQRDRYDIERLILEAVRAFEPRLVNPTVTLVNRPGVGRVLIEIGGSVQVGRALEPLKFELESDVRLADSMKKSPVAAKRPLF